MPQWAGKVPLNQGPGGRADKFVLVLSRVRDKPRGILSETNNAIIMVLSLKTGLGKQ